ncbi:MAG: lipid-A-disaccharide synthase [Qingshengfaniella sp.]
MTGPSVFLIAGEASGDALGAALIAGLRELAPNVQLRGVAGPQMQAAGVRSLFPMDDLTVMGLAEVLPRYRHLKRRLAETVAAILADPPDVLIGIDSPDFCLRVARAVKTANPAIRTVHYVAPSVWAWRPGRAAKMAPFTDQVLALLPFEPPLMEAAGMRCDFVGHPVVAQPQASEVEAEAFRSAHGISPGTPLILALPGSRNSEVARLAPIFGAAFTQLAPRLPGMRVVVPVASGLADLVATLAVDWPIDPILVAASDLPTKRAAFRAADVALAASGTVSLELAAAGTPMVIAYTFNWLSNRLLKRLALVDTVTLVNLVSETRTVPEFLMRACQPGPIAEAIEQVLADSEGQRTAMNLTMDRLGRGGEAPGLRAARAVLDGLGGFQ